MLTLDKLKEWVDEKDALYLLDLMRKYNKRRNSGPTPNLILYIHGTGSNGKTTFARWFAEELNLPQMPYFNDIEFDDMNKEFIKFFKQTTHSLAIVESNQDLYIEHPQVKCIHFPNRFNIHRMNR